MGIISENTFSDNDIGLRIFGLKTPKYKTTVEKNIFDNNEEGIRVVLINSTPLITENEFNNNNISINSEARYPYKVYGVDVVDSLNSKDINTQNQFKNNEIRISQKREIFVIVNYTNNTPFKFVSVIIRDRDGKEVWNGSTNEYGVSSKITTNQTIQLLEYELKGEQKITYSPYNITVEYKNETNWSIVNLDKESKIITINLNEPKPVIKEPESEFNLKFMVGLASIIIFFAMIILSLIGVIPQDRLPIQTALVIGALIIAIIAFLAHSIDSDVALVSATDISGMIIIHPITALVAGFLVAGALEASGAFDAAADLLDRLEQFTIKGKVIFGISGTIVILVNVPTIIAMPCGRILGSALMPAALYFGYKVARQLENPAMVGVIVFAFIVNAAASCGPSPLGGIGTIGEGLTRMEIGSFSDAQQIGIIICTGVCALIIKFITPLIPADLKEEEKTKKEIDDRIENSLKGSDGGKA